MSYLITYSNEAVNLSHVTKVHTRKNVLELKGPDGYTLTSITLYQDKISMRAAVKTLQLLGENEISTAGEFQEHYDRLVGEEVGAQ